MRPVTQIRSSEKPLAPVVIFGFNRPDHLERTLRALGACPEAALTRVFVRIDGPRNEQDANAQKRIHQILKDSTPFADLQVVQAVQNQGLAKSLIAGISEMIRQFGEVIVLEDDLIVSPAFLTYMNYYLEKYRDEEKVISIHGYCYPIAGLPEAFFIRGADCWGWATWKRGWDLFEGDGNRLLQQLRENHLENSFDFDGSFPYTQMLEDQVEGRINSWAIRWNASAFLQNKLTLYPGQSLVRNIGMDGSGTHTGTSDVYDVQLANHFRPASLHVIESQEAKDLFIRYFQSLRPKGIRRWVNLLGKIKNRIFRK